MKKQTLGSRIKNFFSGATIRPALDLRGDGAISVNSFENKPAQIKANISWVFACNQVIADDCSSLPIRLFTKDNQGNEEEIFNHEVLDLFANPSAVLTSRQLWSLYYQYLNLTGEAYLLKIDKDGKILEDNSKLPTALVPLPSHLVNFNLDPVDYRQSKVMFGTKVFPISAVLRDITPDPENPYVGLSIIGKTALTIDTDYQMKRWNNQLFKNGARPGVVITVPDQLQDDSFNRLKQQFDDSYAGTDNAFKKIVLEGGATIQPFMMTQQDLDFLESKRFTRDEIMSMFKVSKSNLGITEDVNRANAEAQEYAFMKRCIKPRVEQFADFINQRLLEPIYHGEVFIKFDNILPEDVDRKLSMAGEAVNNWLTIDEVRELYGYDPLPDGLGNQLYVPLNNVPLNDLQGYLEPLQGTEDPQTGVDTENNPEEPTDPLKSVSEPILDVEQKRLEIGNRKVKDYTLKSQQYEKLIMRASRKMFNRQWEAIKQWLDKQQSKSIKALKALPSKKDWAEEMVDWDNEKQLFQQDLQKILQVIIEEIGEQALRDLVGDSTSFDPYQETVQTAIREFSGQISEAVNSETEKQVRASIAQGLREGETIKQISDRVFQIMTNSSTQRAFTIAQTESANAMNYADTVAWEVSGQVEAKQWFTAEDERVCGFCAEMDKKTIPLGENFYNKGDQAEYTDHNDKTHIMKLDYRPVYNPPLHPNCRCVLLPILKD